MTPPGPCGPDRFVPDLDTGPHVELDTANTRVRDGVNACPTCGSTQVRLEAASGLLSCGSCRHQWSEARVEEQFGLGTGIDALTGTTTGTGTRPGHGSGVVTLECQGCGAQVQVDTAAALSAQCHWCRHRLSVNTQIAGGTVPDAVLPFGVDRAQATAIMTQYLGQHRRSAAARAFSAAAVVGVYLPYMVIDANISVTFDVNVAPQHRLTTDDYFQGASKASKTVELTVDDLVVHSSVRRANRYATEYTNGVIDDLFPFDVKNAVQWNADYLRGFTAEHRDLDVAQLGPVLEHHAAQIAQDRIMPEVHRRHPEVAWGSETVQVEGSRWVTMYLPVWLYTYYHRTDAGTVAYHVAVNGRTGKIAAALPPDRARKALAATRVALAVAFVGLVVAAGSLPFGLWLVPFGAWVAAMLWLSRTLLAPREPDLATVWEAARPEYERSATVRTRGIDGPSWTRGPGTAGADTLLGIFRRQR
ncbi:MAG: TFIIB-type zinc ribbon-containing protein [Micrococcales bacterium]|nr:TFIIB-type zinc ribbon-containing protein [Micrococcales bacterium]MCL2666233.1 TFIIB-type zinc ribbon-containing protein [Micrococcales bacterium]